MAFQTPRPVAYRADENNGGPYSGSVTKKALSRTFALQGLSADVPRKTLSNITNLAHPSPSSTQKDVTKSGPLKQRTVLRNITNENVPSKAVPVAPAKRDAFGQPTEAKKKSRKHTSRVKDTNDHLKLANKEAILQEKAEAYAAEGIEYVHFSGRQAEDLRAAEADAEVEAMAAVALSFRTDLPRVLVPSSELSPIVSALLALEELPPSPRVPSPPRHSARFSDVEAIDLDDLASLLECDCTELLAC